MGLVDNAVRLYPWTRGRPALILSGVFGVATLIGLEKAAQSEGIVSLVLRLAIAVNLAVHCGIYFEGWRRGRLNRLAEQRGDGPPAQ